MKLFEVTYKRRLNDNMVWLKVYAPLVAKHAKPGQFIILRTDEYGERIPLTMAGHDEKDGTIDLIYAAVGRTTMLMDQLEEGDHFLIHVLNETLSYEVDKISVVKPEETSSLAVEEGKDLVTLLTCTPYGVNTERLLVRGHRVPYVEQEVADEKTPLSGISLHTNYLLWVIIGLVITTIFILVLYLKEKKLQKKKNETS